MWGVGANPVFAVSGIISAYEGEHKVRPYGIARRIYLTKAWTHPLS